MKDTVYKNLNHLIVLLLSLFPATAVANEPQFLVDKLNFGLAIYLELWTIQKNCTFVASPSYQNLPNN